MTEESTDSLPSFSDFFKLNSTNAYITMLFSLVFAPIFFFFFPPSFSNSVSHSKNLIRNTHNTVCERERDTTVSYNYRDRERKSESERELFLSSVCLCTRQRRKAWKGGCIK